MFAENITLNALNMYGVIINKIKNKYNKKKWKIELTGLMN